jgi:hypothetical protein
MRNLRDAGVSGLIIPADHRDPEGVLDRFPEVVRSM